ncbi:hypothetical protein [Roseibium sp. RKSG952]|uniref:hypothetical protein n=1 Tax=Roseibium sp. RKSG952 TaxID=2529384 RepID=UPI0012BCAF3A|nr:hypothetical protein [Roseibium sp. RKSG952]MTH95263.1 hypothetical protein [Roseibium sp. RKSG952]
MVTIISSENLAVDTAAKTLPGVDNEGCRVLNPTELEGVTLRELLIHEEDNDLEAWYLSEGGQFIRNVGKPHSRWMHMSTDEAWFIIGDIVDDETLERLQGVGFFTDASPAP